MGSILHLHEVPESGGDTLFASMYAAYEALSAPMRTFVETLDAVHESIHNLGGYFGAKQEDLRDGCFPEATHPVVCRHPETGRKLLFVNEAFTTRIAELEPAESKAVLDFLYRHIGSPKFQCRFRWRKHSIAFWDNRSAQHLALWDYYPKVRSGHRFTIAGSRPVR
jgi:taurine dioxygenase